MSPQALPSGLFSFQKAQSMSASQSGLFSLQQFTDAGGLLVGGRIYTYSAGTTTQKTAYTNAAGTVAHTYTSDGAGGLYIALNARGELPAPLYLATGSYDIVLKRADSTTVWSRQADPTGDAAAAVSSTLTTFTAQVASAAGALGVGFAQAGGGAVTRNVQAELRETYHAAQFGVTFDNVTDDTTAWNLLILRVAQAGGGTILGRNGTTSYVAGANGLLIPSNVKIDLRGGILRGTGNGTSGNTLVNSAKVVSGALVLNVVGDAVVGAGIFNGTLYQCGQGLSLRNCIDACEFRNLQLAQTYNGLLSQFCLYSVFDHIMARNTSPGVAFRFSNNANNLTLKNLHAVGTNPGTWGTGFVFDTKTYGTTMLNCSQEFCVTGILTEEVHGLKLLGNYAESVSVGLNLQGSTFRKVGVHISACYFSNVSILVQGKTVNNFRWDASNERAANCLPGTIDLQNDTTIATGSQASCTGVIELSSSDLLMINPPLTGTLVPSWLLLSDGIELRATAAATQNGGLGTPIYAKANLRSGGAGGIPPFEYAGYTDALTGTVPFATPAVPTGTSVTGTVTTEIRVSHSGFVVYAFDVIDDNGSWTWWGLARGTQLFNLASTPGSITLSLSSVGNFLVANFAGMKNVGGTATITGQIRFM